MSPNLVTISWNERMETAFRRMRDQRIRHLPVTRENGEIVGILSDRDVQRAMISRANEDSAAAILSESFEFDPAARVRDYMSWPAISIEQDADIRFVADRMIAEKVSSVLVRRGSAAVGIVTSEDLLKLLVQILGDPVKSGEWTLAKVMDFALAPWTSTVT
ncbi:MAG: CBS domain-containing protein [Bdellovibrionota bacterium]